jgi:hypothetical protein
VQAVVQVAIKVAEEYLPGGEKLSEALETFSFFERAEEVIIQEEEEKERIEEKDQVMAAAANVAATEVRRANQLINDQIAALGTFTGDSDAWYDWQKNFKRLTREFDNDLKYRVFRLMYGGLAARRLDEALSNHPVPNDGDPCQHAVDTLNGIYVNEGQKDHEIVDFLQIKQKPSEPVYSSSKDLRNYVYVLKIWALSQMMSSPEKLSWMDSYLISEGNYKREQDQGLIKRLKGDLKMSSVLMDIF